MEIHQWLLDSDPTLRWQVERDILNLPPSVWQATKDRMPQEGFARELLGHQLSDGTWLHGAHFPKGYRGEGEGQPYTSTGISLSQPREWGVPATALLPNTSKLLEDLRWEYEDLPFWGGEVDVCINAYTLSNGIWLGRDMTHLINWFEDHQLEDGGWNCEWVDGVEVSSFHSTLNALIALLDYEMRTGKSARIKAMREKAQDYFLKRRLMFKLSTGELLPGWATHFGYPYRFAYSVIRALDTFRQISIWDEDNPDPRLEEAIEFVRSARQADGTWTQGYRHPGEVWFEVDAPVGQPSKWLTFHAMRILDWWDTEKKNEEASRLTRM